MTSVNAPIAAPLLAGAAAGLCVDLSLYPLDTLKTRLQARSGFWNSGGFRRLYKGLGSVAIGSAPGAFFVSYEFGKTVLPQYIPNNAAAVHMFSASFGETIACLVRVPTEVIKQRQQALVYGRVSSFRALQLVLRTSGIRGLYQGYAVTVAREIPFSIIQFPIYEYLKSMLRSRRSTALPAFPDAALCGSIAGAIAAATTTPLDVTKTRVMLAHDSPSHSRSFFLTMTDIYRQEGLKKLFSGVLPRTLWISGGGAIFLGVYELVLDSVRTPMSKVHLPS